jgi:putative acetyltransferase
MLRGGDLTVDVNEQNPAAVGFYEAVGFVVVGRSPLDDAGRPFPLLHMRRPVGGR